MATIVTAEDNDDIRAYMQRSLQRAGHEVVATADGADGLAAARLHRPDVIITDVDMPRMTGLDLCRAVRRDPDLSHIPVLVVSGSVDLTGGVADEAGVTAVLAKPFTPDELHHEIAKVLGD
jgi:CheY-like chemotaxis protein